MAARDAHGEAYFGKFQRVLVAIDRQILSLPLGQRRVARGKRDVEHASDHDGMGIPLDGFFHLAFDCRQCAPTATARRRRG